MKKKSMALVLALCMCLALTMGAFASGEASGEASGGPSGGGASYAYTVTANGVETTEDSDLVLSVPFGAAGISGFAAESGSTGLVAVQGDDTTEGAVAVTLGGSGEMFDAADLAIYPNAQEKLGFTAFDSKADMGGAARAQRRLRRRTDGSSVCRQRF